MLVRVVCVSAAEEVPRNRQQLTRYVPTLAHALKNNTTLLHHFQEQFFPLVKITKLRSLFCTV